MPACYACTVGNYCFVREIVGRSCTGGFVTVEIFLFAKQAEWISTVISVFNDVIYFLFGVFDGEGGRGNL